MKVGRKKDRLARMILMSDQKLQGNRAVTLTATVRGRVQGVGFRMFVLDAARRLGLTGYVRNLPDRSVHVSAHGSREALERLLGLLYRGPAGAKVTAVDSAWADVSPVDLPTHFEVRP